MMDEGRIIEEAAAQVFFETPRHERSQQFLRAIL